MQALPALEPTVLFPRPGILSEDGTGAGPWLELTDHPDISRNPRLWLKLYLEGLTRHRRTLALAKRSTDLLDLGCGGGWFAVAAARANPAARIEAVDKDGRLLDWGRYYLDRLRNKGARVGQVSFVETDIAELDWGAMEEKFDFVHAGFILSRCTDPGEALQGIYRSLRPGGWLVYHDATDPPDGNLDRLARLHHQWAKWRDPSSDPWSWRRVWRQRYLYDTVRMLARHNEPSESHVLTRLEELFAIRHQERSRAVLDLYLRQGRKAPQRQMLMLPAMKLLDDLSVRFGFAQGACRYVVAQKR